MQLRRLRPGRRGKAVFDGEQGPSNGQGFQRNSCEVKISLAAVLSFSACLSPLFVKSWIGCDRQGVQAVISNMLREQADIAFISKVTGLPAAEIVKLTKNGDSE